MSEADRDFQDRRFLDGKYATPSRPARLTELYHDDRWAPASSPVAEIPSGEELARQIAELAARPQRSLSEELRLATLTYAAAAAAPPFPASSPHQRPRPAVLDLAWVQKLRDDQAANFKLELKRGLQRMLPCGRIRVLRAALGWTQGRAAVELGISRRTLIRHEGQHRRRWIRWSLLKRLRELEEIYEPQIIAYLDHGGPVRA